FAPRGQRVAEDTRGLREVAGVGERVAGQGREADVLEDVAFGRVLLGALAKDGDRGRELAHGRVRAAERLGEARALGRTPAVERPLEERDRLPPVTELERRVPEPLERLGARPAVPRELDDLPVEP